MRALLVINPKATTTTARSRDILVHALGADLDLAVMETRYRGHATALVRRAVKEGCCLVVGLGGDGTVNEMVNGLLADGPSPDLPGLAVVPGGSANVFVRSLGLPRDPIEATAAVLDALRQGRRRAVGVGLADGRYFTFCAGLGLDAEVIRAVEGFRASGYRSTPSLYVRTALRHFFAVTDRRHPALRLERPGAEPVDQLFFAVVSNTSPWTYLGPCPVNPNPLASFATGLDLLALRQLHTVATLDHVRRFITCGDRPPRGRHALSLHDLPELTLVAARPMAFQLDGEYLGERESVTLRAVPAALQVVA